MFLLHLHHLCTHLPRCNSASLHLTFSFPLSVHPIRSLPCDFFRENLLSLPPWPATFFSLHPSALLYTPLVVLDSSKAGIRRANSRWTHSNTQLCHLLQSHDWAANPLQRHDAPSYLTHRSIMTKEQDREWEWKETITTINTTVTPVYETQEITVWLVILASHMIYFWNWI